MGRNKRRVLGGVFVAVATLWIGNTSVFETEGNAPFLLAHRGIHQRYQRDSLDRDTCTARIMYPPQHAYLENAIASMAGAFAHGASYVELDVHPTTDGQFAVFHDWTLDCRTNGRGVTRKHTLAELKRLDIGYGYTADSGRTFPFRGKGAGLMPSLDEVLSTFPTQRFLINIKSNDGAEGKMLAEYLRARGMVSDRLMVYGGDRPLATFRKALPATRTMSRQTQLRCARDYFLTGWTGRVPMSCHRIILLVPVNYGFLLWGWPNRFVNRMQSADSLVIMTGPYGGGGFSSGIDSAEDCARMPAHFSGGIWTNRIEAFQQYCTRAARAQPASD